MTDNLAHRFAYHPPRSDARREAHEDVRALCRTLAEELDLILPDSREKSVTITKIEEAMFWANAALARTPDGKAATSAHSIQKMDAPGIVYNSFCWALNALHAGKKVARVGWNGKGMHLYLVDAAVGGGTTRRAYISMLTAQGDHVPWVASQTDLLAIDWHEVP